MYGVVALGGVELARLVGDGLQSIALVLKQRCADGKLGGVCVELKGVGEVRCCQDWCGCQSVLELSKGLALCGPGVTWLLWTWALRPGTRMKGV